MRSPDDLTISAPNRRYCDRDVDQSSVLAHADGVEVLNPLAASGLFQDLTLFVPSVRRQDNRSVPAYHLCSTVPVETLCPRIPRLDNAVCGFSNDGVVGRLDQCAQP